MGNGAVRVYCKNSRGDVCSLRILIFSSREICYFSSNFFANQMGEAFEKLGHTVEICELAKEDDLDEKLDRFLEKDYDLILDFNSLLPRMALEDGSLFVDHLNGPFYNWVIDHPLFHHVALKTPMKSSHAIVVDTSQMQYISDYYPEVRDTHFLPLAATESFISVPKENDVTIFFPATYASLENVEHSMETVPEAFRKTMRKLLEMRIADPLLPMEEAYRCILSERGEEKSVVEFRNEMNQMYPVDAYVRNYYRQKVLDALLQSGIPVKVMGEDWNKYKAPPGGRLTIEKAVFFHLSFEKIAREHILLDVSPFFHHGIHDRVFAGMANHAAVLTDENPVKRQFFPGEKECMLYSLKDLKGVAARAEELLTNHSLREEMQEQAYACFGREHTWECRAKEVLSYRRKENE